MEIISSSQNPKVKQLQALQQKSQERRQRGLFVVEGRREIARALANGYVVNTLFCCPEICGDDWQQLPAGKVVVVTPYVYDKVAYRGGTEGMIAEVVARPHTLADLKLSANPLLVVLESIEKPGNLGAVLRTADAVGADAVVVCDPLTDLYNPNLMRSSTGAFFSVPTAVCTSEECIAWLQSHDIRILTAQLQDSSLYYDADMCRPTALVFGTEATGLTPQWRHAADAHIRLPMLGCADSLNVSVSAAVLMYEALRQRSAAHVS